MKLLERIFGKSQATLDQERFEALQYEREQNEKRQRTEEEERERYAKELEENRERLRKAEASLKTFRAIITTKDGVFDVIRKQWIHKIIGSRDRVYFDVFGGLQDINGLMTDWAKNGVTSLEKDGVTHHVKWSDFISATTEEITPAPAAEPSQEP